MTQMATTQGSLVQLGNGQVGSCSTQRRSLRSATSPPLRGRCSRRRVGDDGFVRVDRTGQTSVSGVWVAGNASNPRAQVITAAGEGSAAAIAINTDLVQEDIQNALSRVAAESDEWASLKETGGIQHDQHQ